MAGMTAAQLCTQACQIAKAPGYTAQAGQLLNVILQELAQDYNFEVARSTYYFTMSPTATAVVGLSLYGSGPYDLPAGFLRLEDENAATYNIGDGVPRPLIGCDLTEFDMLVQQAGNQSYPHIIAVDLSLADAADQGEVVPGPQAYLWPPPNGAYAAQLRYFKQMADIATPETSAQIPWFPNQSYLLTRLAGELMRITDDDRMSVYLGLGPEGAQGILTRYLKNKDNGLNRAKTVKLDRRRFGGGNYNNLPNTKLNGW